eukprot:6077219-Alexandrium_andersonii.AAC.1
MPGLNDSDSQRHGPAELIRAREVSPHDLQPPLLDLCQVRRGRGGDVTVSYTHLRAHETSAHL